MTIVVEARRLYTRAKSAAEVSIVIALFTAPTSAVEVSIVIALFTE